MRFTMAYEFVVDGRRRHISAYRTCTLPRRLSFHHELIKCSRTLTDGAMILLRPSIVVLFCISSIQFWATSWTGRPLSWIDSGSILALRGVGAGVAFDETLVVGALPIAVVRSSS